MRRWPPRGPPALALLCLLSLLLLCGSPATSAQAPPPPPPPLQLVLLNTTEHPGAVCLDGSPGGYFFRPGYGAGAANWVVFFEGGGWCFTELECIARSQTALGSSRNWTAPLLLTQKRRQLGGMVSANQTLNPDFYNWNVVDVMYCDGASFAGDLDEPVRGAGNQTVLFFRGKRIIDAVLSDILNNATASGAGVQRLLLTGCSAGAATTYMHCDRLANATRERYPGAVVKCLGDAGFLPDLPDVRGNFLLRGLFNYMYFMHNVTGSIGPACNATALAPFDFYRCFYAQHFLPSIQTPTFVLQSQYDPFALQYFLLGGLPLRQEWEGCLPSLNRSCPVDKTLDINKFGVATIAVVNQTVVGKRAGVNGALLYSCSWHCPTATYDESWEGLVVGGRSLRQMVGDWFFERGPVGVVVDVPAPGLNATCGFLLS